jgi:hypothetical protein
MMQLELRNIGRTAQTFSELHFDHRIGTLGTLGVTPLADAV